MNGAKDSRRPGSGSLSHTRTWQDKNGTCRHAAEIIANEIKMPRPGSGQCADPEPKQPLANGTRGPLRHHQKI